MTYNVLMGTLNPYIILTYSLIPVCCSDILNPLRKFLGVRPVHVDALRMVVGCRFCVGDRYYLLGVHILCEADYEDHLRQFSDQLQLCNGHLQSVSMATQPPPLDNEAMTSGYPPPASQLQQLVAASGRRFHSSTENHKLPLDDRSSGYGSPSPPCV